MLGRLLGQAGRSAEAATHYLTSDRAYSSTWTSAWQGVATNTKFTARRRPADRAHDRRSWPEPMQISASARRCFFALGEGA